MPTVTIATEAGSQEAAARPTNIPGLVITGPPTCYSITHVASGYQVCHASIHNVNATLPQVRAAMVKAGTGEIDWTLPGDHLPFDACRAWCLRFGDYLTVPSIAQLP